MTAAGRTVLWSPVHYQTAKKKRAKYGRPAHPDIHERLLDTPTPRQKYYTLTLWLMAEHVRGNFIQPNFRLYINHGIIHRANVDRIRRSLWEAGDPQTAVDYHTCKVLCPALLDLEFVRPKFKRRETPRGFVKRRLEEKQKREAECPSTT